MFLQLIVVINCQKMCVANRSRVSNCNGPVFTWGVSLVCQPAQLGNPHHLYLLCIYTLQDAEEKQWQLEGTVADPHNHKLQTFCWTCQTHPPLGKHRFWVTWFWTKQLLPFCCACVPPSCNESDCYELKKAQSLPVKKCPSWGWLSL